MDKHYDPVIVFSFSKKECEAYALALSKLDLITEEEKVRSGFCTLIVSLAVYHCVRKINTLRSTLQADCTCGWTALRPSILVLSSLQCPNAPFCVLVPALLIHLCFRRVHDCRKSLPMCSRMPLNLFRRMTANFHRSHSRRSFCVLPSRTSMHLNITHNITRLCIESASNCAA